MFIINRLSLCLILEYNLWYPDKFQKPCKIRLTTPVAIDFYVGLWHRSLVTRCHNPNIMTSSQDDAILFSKSVTSVDLYYIVTG